MDIAADPVTPAELAAHLGRPVAYHATLAAIAGGNPDCGLVLSQAVYLQRHHAGPGGWWWYTAAQWLEATSLSRSRLEAARTRCLDLGLIQYEVRGLPARGHYRVRLDRVLDSLKKLSPPRRPSSRPQVATQFAAGPQAPERILEITSGQPPAPATPAPAAAGSAAWTDARLEAVAVMVGHGCSDWDARCVLRDPLVRIADGWLVGVVTSVAARYRDFAASLAKTGQRVRNPGGWWRTALRNWRGHQAGADVAVRVEAADRQRRKTEAAAEADTERRRVIAEARASRGRTTPPAADHQHGLAVLRAALPPLTQTTPPKPKSDDGPTLATLLAARARQADVIRQTAQYHPRC